MELHYKFKSYSFTFSPRLKVVLLYFSSHMVFRLKEQWVHVVEFCKYIFFHISLQLLWATFSALNVQVQTLHTTATEKYFSFSLHRKQNPVCQWLLTVSPLAIGIREIIYQLVSFQGQCRQLICRLTALEFAKTIFLNSLCYKSGTCRYYTYGLYTHACIQI